MSYRDKFYQNYYKTQASRYSEVSETKQIDHSIWILDKEILPHLPTDKDTSILELACGHGAFLKMLQQNQYTNARGIDISADQIEKAKQLGIDNVECTDILTFLETNTDTYDVIVGIDIIEHLNKSELLTLLEQIKERLKVGGTAIFRTPNCDAPLGSTFYFGDFTHEIYLNYFSAEQVMLTMGFKEIHISPSHVGIRNPLKNFFRAILWFKMNIWYKLVLFASGRSSKKVLFTPNLIISVKK